MIVTTEGAAARFWLKVKKTDSCWMWIGASRKGGYGVMQIAGRLIATHRLSWELAHGPIPPNTMVLHRCDTPACVNPEHLFLGDCAANLLDAALKGHMGSKRGVPRKTLTWMQANARKRRAHVARLLELLGSIDAVAEVLALSRTGVERLLRENRVAS